MQNVFQKLAINFMILSAVSQAVAGPIYSEVSGSVPFNNSMSSVLPADLLSQYGVQLRPLPYSTLHEFGSRGPYTFITGSEEAGRINIGGVPQNGACAGSPNALANCFFTIDLQNIRSQFDENTVGILISATHGGLRNQGYARYNQGTQEHYASFAWGPDLTINYSGFAIENMTTTDLDQILNLVMDNGTGSGAIYWHIYEVSNVVLPPSNGVSSPGTLTLLPAGAAAAAALKLKASSLTTLIKIFPNTLGIIVTGGAVYHIVERTKSQPKPKAGVHRLGGGR